MGKLITLSYLFFFIALITQIIDFGFSSSDYYYDHYLQLTLFVLAVSPIIGVILGIFGKKGNHRLIAIASNALFFAAVAPLALLNFWIMTFGK